jgi:polyprenyl-phospho-N-acetylgalactosaminyl synthase
MGSVDLYSAASLTGEGMDSHPGVRTSLVQTATMRGAPERSRFVVVPAYNEASVIGATVRPLIDAGFSVVVVDDGSSDGTWDVIQQLPVYGIRHGINLGQGAALQTGMSFAVKQGADYVVHFDADGQHRPVDINVLLKPLLDGQADVVLGSRFLTAASAAAVPFRRRLFLRGATYVNFVLTGVMLSDAHNGLRALTREAAQRIQLRENGYAHASEILHQIRSQRLAYTERPTTILYSDYSVAKGQSLWNGFNIVFELLLTKLFQ